MYRPGRLAGSVVRYAPAIVLGDVAVAILARWTDVVPALAVLALAALTLAAAVIAGIVYIRRPGLRTNAQLGFPRNRDAIAYDAAGRGTRDGFYGLAIACFAGIIMSGGRMPQILVMLAAFLLTLGWGAATQLWPVDEAEG